MGGELRKARLTRIETSDEGTFGIFKTDTFECYTVELPWRGNAIGASCIPAGSYKFVWSKSPKHGECYEAEKVEGRTDIQIHSANWAGDVTKGFKSQLQGCIAPGRAIMSVAGQKGVSSSRDALAGLVLDLEKEPFLLTVSWSEGLP